MHFFHKNALFIHFQREVFTAISALEARFSVQQVLARQTLSCTAPKCPQGHFRSECDAELGSRPLCEGNLRRSLKKEEKKSRTGLTGGTKAFSDEACPRT